MRGAAASHSERGSVSRRGERRTQSFNGESLMVKPGFSEMKEATSRRNDEALEPSRSPSAHARTRGHSSMRRP